MHGLLVSLYVAAMWAAMWAPGVTGFLLDSLLGTSHDHQGPFCPTWCRVSDPQGCLQGATCSSRQYCALHLTSDGVYKGFCTGDSHLSQCQRDVTNYPCSSGFHFSHGHDCKLCCCTTSDCSHQCVKPRPASGPPPAVTVTVDTVVTVQPIREFNYSELLYNCSDRIADGGCASLVDEASNSSVCRVTPDLCPESCGLCDVISGFDCHDTVLDNGCQTQYVDKGVCSDPLAQFACPSSCGVCDVMLHRLVHTALQGQLGVQ